MSATVKQVWTREDYDRDADEYLASLTWEHFMESTAQSIQRDVTVTSLHHLRASRPGLRCFGELLVHWRAGDRTRHVVPDNLVVLDFTGEELFKSWAVELGCCPLFWAMEYVSESNPRKDYVASFEKYEQVLKVPYYLIFDPEHQDLRLYRHNGTRYVPVEANAERRYAIPEVEVEVAIHDRWARFWHKGKLLAITPELLADLDRVTQCLDETEATLGETTAKLGQTEVKLGETTAKLGQTEVKLGETTAKLGQTEAKLDETAAKLAAAMKDNAQAIRDKDAAEQHLSDRNRTVAAGLRPVVEARARLAGRQDVLDHLAASNADQLLTWLAELA